MNFMYSKETLGVDKGGTEGLESFDTVAPKIRPSLFSLVSCYSISHDLHDTFETTAAFLPCPQHWSNGEGAAQTAPGTL